MEEDDVQTARQIVSMMGLVCLVSVSLGPCPSASSAEAGVCVSSDRCHRALSESLPVVLRSEAEHFCLYQHSGLCQPRLELPTPEQEQVMGLAVSWKLLWGGRASGPPRQIVMSYTLRIPNSL